MPSYHVHSTGSARSVGPRRIFKKYTFADGTVVYSRSIQEAIRLAKKPTEIPVLDPTAVIPMDADTKPVRKGTATGGSGGGTGVLNLTPSTKVTVGNPG